MNIVVMSRHDIERQEFTEPSAVISIFTPGDQPAKLRLNEHVQAVLVQGFHDIDPAALQRDHDWALEHGATAYSEDEFAGLMANCMTKDQASELIEFVDKWKNVDVMYVHCGEGRSRSPAIATAICRMHQMDEASVEHDGAWTPNQHVLSTIMAEDMRRTVAALREFNKDGGWVRTAKEKKDA